MVTLGDEVKDTVSGFQGIAISRHSYFQGCDRVNIQPPIDKDGKLPKPETFDEPQIMVIDAGKAIRQAQEDDPGGPEKYADTGRVEPSR